MEIQNIFHIKNQDHLDDIIKCLDYNKEPIHEESTIFDIENPYLIKDLETGIWRKPEIIKRTISGLKTKTEQSKSLLKQAEEIINGSRAEDYGSVTDNFSKIAKGWEEIFSDGKFIPRRVALAMIWLKICRDVNTPKHDNILDIAGYAGCVGKMDNEANQ